VTTCSRCGKENQKHYKFCLGCGAKLEAAAPAAEPARPADTAPAAVNAASAVPRVTGTGSIAAAVPAATVDSLAAAAPAPHPVELAPTAESPILSSPRASGAMAAAIPSLSGPPLGFDAPMPGTSPGAAAQSPGSRDMVACPKCGRMVVSTYAFCGACGHRMKPGAAAAAVPAPVARTIAQASPSNANRTAPRGHLTLIRPDGTEGGVHPLQDGENLIGRGQGSLFDADPYLSPRHAEFAFTEDGLVVRDLRSLNGVFVKIVAEERLESGDVLRIGQELLRFNVISPPVALEDGTDVIGTPNPGYWGRVSVIVGRDVEGPAFPLYDETVVLGRERGDILFPEDGYVSGRHAQIAYRDGNATLTDLGSSNGTFFRIRGSRPVPQGTLLLMGQQLFRASYR
jgi:pSer/pThr/pTyr-binding forkhead associated (FHA) protein